MECMRDECNGVLIKAPDPMKHAEYLFPYKYDKDNEEDNPVIFYYLHFCSECKRRHMVGKVESYDFLFSFLENKGEDPYLL